MEIDFLGLKSPKFNVKQHNTNYSVTDTFSGGGGVETSLSLSTTTSLDYCHRDNLNFSQKNTEAQQPSPCLVAMPVFRHSTATGFLFDLNQCSTDSRNICEIPGEPASLLMIYSGTTANVFCDTLPSQKAVRISGKESLGLSDGDTPTVAMARRATLARFLEKRSHRINEASTSNLVAKSLNDGIEKGKRSLTRS